VDPLNPVAIAQAIDYLVTHPEEAQGMGANGRKAVIERYNWANEEQKLFAFYERTLSQPVK
jgi:glycosyltransferase involved in cell wall biosynthesis